MHSSKKYQPIASALIVIRENIPYIQHPC